MFRLKGGERRTEMAARTENWNCAGKVTAGATGPCLGPATVRCGSCGAVSYCSRSHQMAHWKVHKKECSRMAQQMARAGDLHDFPFLFIEDAVRLVDEGVVTICSFLNERELHLKGLWQGECECADPTFTSFYSPGREIQSHGLQTEPWQGVWMIYRVATAVLDVPLHRDYADPSEASGEVLTGWRDYYRWRKLPFESPVAVLLHWPLTLYHAIGLVSKCMQTTKLKLGSMIRVHYLGPEKELQILQVFAELMALLPGAHVHIDMIGPAVPASRDGEVVQLAEYSKCLDAQCTCKRRREEKLANSNLENMCLCSGQVTLKLWRGFYHDRYLDLVPAPEIVVAPNAGIAAFATWQPTIELLSVSKTPAIFTDYCEEAANLAAEAMSLTHPDVLTYPVQANPFRQPFSPRDKAGSWMECVRKGGDTS